MQGYIVVITRNGSLGGRYPLTSTECLFGQSPSCDVRVYVANVARKHCLITALPNERAYIRNLSPSNTTLVNGIQIGVTQYELQHADVITVGDRHFRWEYPISSRQKTPAKKTTDSDVRKTPTCMVQVPMSVFKKKRHSSPGVLRENKIISFTSQDGVEPDPKRRKTLHNVTDLGMDKKIVRPINKQLKAVTQPASSPKSLTTFRVLLKSASKRKSSIPISKTPKPQKKVVSTKYNRSKSLSPQKLSPKQQCLLKSIPVVKVSKLNIPPLKPVTKTLSLSTPLRNSILTLSKKTPPKNSPAMKKTIKRKSTVAIALNIKTSPISSPKNKSKKDLSLKVKSPVKTPKASPSKTLQNNISGKSVSSTKSPLPKRSLSRSPSKTPIAKTSKTPQASPTRSVSPAKTPLKATQMISPVKDKTHGNTPRGRSPKTPLATPTRESISLPKSPSPKALQHGSSVKDKTPGRNPKGRPSKTPQTSVRIKSLSPAESPSPKASRSGTPKKVKTPGNTTRGRPSKTPKLSPTQKFVSAPKSQSSKDFPSGSPVGVKTPNRIHIGRPSKTPQASPKRSASLAKTPLKTYQIISPVKHTTPGRNPRGRPSKTPQRSPRISPAKSPQTSSRSGTPMRNKTPVNTPRGRPPKTPLASSTRESISPSPKASRSGTPVKDKTPGNTPRERLPKTPVASPTRESISPAKSPSPKASRSGTPVKDKTPGKTPRGRPPKTPLAAPTRESISPAKSPSPKASRSGTPVKDKTPGNTPRGRPPKTPLASPTRESISPAKSPSPKASRSGTPVKDKTPGNTPRGRPSKTALISPTRSISPPKSQSLKSSRSGSPVGIKSPDRTPGGRPSKTPQSSPERRPLSPAKSPLEASQIISPVKDNTPGRNPVGRPSKTPQTSSKTKSLSPPKSLSPKSCRSGTPVKDQTPGRNLRGRPSKTAQTSPRRKSFSSGDEISIYTPTQIVSKSMDKSYFAVKSITKNRNESDVLSPHRFIFNRSFSTEGAASNVYNLSMDQSFGNIETENKASSNVTKSARRSAVRSGLSSSIDVTTSSKNKPFLLKSSTKKAEIAKLQIDSKRKFDTEAEAKAERAAKRLKMETPKSLTKNKKAALLVCHSPKSQKRPLFSEVLKSHLSTVKKKQAAAAVHSVVVKKAIKPTYLQPLSLEVPTSFKFNSTGHANSPETIVIRKKVKKTPGPKPRKGRKSYIHTETKTIEDKNLEGVPELFKTPKLIISSLKSASSAKKSQNIRVRFSLQNDVQSPSGRRSSVMHSDETKYFGSPIVSSKKYIGTPRPSMRRISDTSLMHSSIMEESPLAQEIDTPNVTNSSKTSDKSYDFSAYSPSSPTLQFSRISGVSSILARKSIDFLDYSASDSSKESPKRKRSIQKLNDTLTQTSSSSSKRFSFASVSSYKSRNSSEFQPSPDGCARLSQSDLFVLSSADLDVSQGSRLTRKSRSKQNSSVEDSEDITSTFAANISQIPLPPSPSPSKTKFTSPTSLSLLESVGDNSLRSTRSSKSSIVSDTHSLFESPQIRKSKIQSSTGSRIASPGDSPSSQASQKTNQSLNLRLSNCENDSSLSELPKRISSTPKVQQYTDIYSPVSSPISIFDKRSLRSLGSPCPQNYPAEPYISPSLTKNQTFKTPLATPGKKPRKGSTRMNASNAEILSPESQVPVAAVKPSTRKKHANESYSSASESVSLPAFSVSHDISERSMDRSLVQKMMDSRASGLDQSRNSRSTTPSPSGGQSNLSLGSLSSSRRKRKSSASSSIRSVDATTFDFTSAMTPQIPTEMFVSPLDKVNDDLTNVSGVKRILNPRGNSPVSSYVDVRGVKKLLKTPKTQNDLTDVVGVKRVMNPRANSPISSYVDVRGVKRLLKTPQPSLPLTNYASIEGIKELFKQSPVADYTNVAGVKNLYSASVEPNYMNVKGVRRIFKETKVPNSPDLAGVEVLFESPKKIMDECNQPSSKPVGMVPPMSRHSSGNTTSEGPTVETLDDNIEDNAEELTRYTENGSQINSRRKTLVLQQVTDKQTKSNMSRKSRRTNTDIQIVCEQVIPSLPAEKEDGNKINQANKRNSDKLKKPMDVSETASQPSVSNVKSGKTKTRKKINQLMDTAISPKQEVIENQDISLNTKPNVGRRTRQTRHQETIDSADIPGCSNEESKRVKSSRQQEKETNDHNKGKLESIGRKTRGRARSTVKPAENIEDISLSQISDQKTDIISPDNLKTKKVMGSKNQMKALDIDTEEAQQGIQITRKSRRDKVNVTSNLGISSEKSDIRSERHIIESEPDEGTKGNVRSRRGQRNQDKATPLEPTQPAGTVAGFENNINKPKERGKRGVSKKVQEGNSKSPESKPKTIRDAKSGELPKTRKRKSEISQDSATNLSLFEKEIAGKRDKKLILESSLSEPSTSQRIPPVPENQKGTRRRVVQFDIITSLTPKNSSPKKRAAKKSSAAVKDKATSKTRADKIESPTSNTSPEKKVRAKRVATKTKASPKLKSAAKIESPTSNTSPEKKVRAKRVATKTKASPKLKSAAKDSGSSTPENKQPVKRKATRAKASPSLEAVAIASASPTNTTPEKKQPAKRKATRAKASPKLETPTKASASSTHTTPEKKQPAKRKATRSKASPKLETPTKSSASSTHTTPEKKQPAKRKATRAKASPKLETPTKVEPRTSNKTNKVLVKKVTAKTKASPKLRPVAKVASPTSKGTKKVSATKVTAKTKATPKLKAAKRKSSTPLMSPPAKRITRSRK